MWMDHFFQLDNMDAGVNPISAGCEKLNSHSDIVSLSVNSQPFRSGLPTSQMSITDYIKFSCPDNGDELDRPTTYTKSSYSDSVGKHNN